MPSYLSQPGGPPGSRFNYGRPGDEVPARLPGNTQVANFLCNVPRAATPWHPARPSLYGHGLFGDTGEVNVREAPE